MNYQKQSEALEHTEALENSMEEYISVSTYAARKGVSTQTVRNWVKKGVVQTISFRRGKMNGYLVRCDEKD